MRGGDLSWPNCNRRPDGRRALGLPLPTKKSKFWVIGLTYGRGFTRNPCLRQHVAAAARRGVLASAYTLVTFPGSAELRAHRGEGPFGTRTRNDELSNVGYAQMIHALDAMKSAKFDSPFVWVDIEPRRTPRWTSSTSRNRAVIRGALRAAKDRGIGVGIYTYANAWRQIAGSMKVDVPLWAPGHSHARTFGARMRATKRSCAGSGFTGGPLVLTQWVWRNRDYNVTCPAITKVSVPMWVRPGAAAA